MTTDGKQGRLPWWLPVLNAAERLHCPPWEIEPGDPPVIWMWRRFAADAVIHAVNQDREWQTAKQQRLGRAMQASRGTA